MLVPSRQAPRFTGDAILVDLGAMFARRFFLLRGRSTPPTATLPCRPLGGPIVGSASVETARDPIGRRMVPRAGGFPESGGHYLAIASRNEVTGQQMGGRGAS